MQNRSSRPDFESPSILVPAPTPVSILVVSCSLNHVSLSHRLAQAAEVALRDIGARTTLVDLREWDLPFCDGGDSYDHPSVKPLSAKIADASAVLLASPVYNYDLNAAAKNLVEMTGTAWSDKPVGFLCSAGGLGSYMSSIGLANSLMFDFRSLIIPRSVYATSSDFDTEDQLEQPVQLRVQQLARTAVDLARALNWLKTSNGGGPTTDD